MAGPQTPQSTPPPTPAVEVEEAWQVYGGVSTPLSNNIRSRDLRTRRTELGDYSLVVRAFHIYIYITYVLYIYYILYDI